jgi:HTH-type transcriptional regulator, competence development regulator
MIGQKLREYRESKGLLQRQVASELQVDTAYISKIESSEKPVSRLHLNKLAKLFGTSENELLTLWLADKVFDVVKDESVGLKAIGFAEHELLKLKKAKQ